METNPPPQSSDRVPVKRADRALVVSLHDVSPHTFERSRLIVEKLEGMGVGKISLLVIPDHHHQGHFLANKEFCDWLLAQHRAGHEIVMHGYYHQRVRKPSESVLQKWVTRTYTADEGEFYDITEEEASELVAKSREEFASLGLHPEGFIAPAWLLSDAGEAAVRKAGLRYTTRIGSVLDFSNDVKHDSQSMVYSPRTATRRTASLAWNAALFRRLKSNSLLRVGIHPPDYDFTAIWRQIENSIALTLEERPAMTYWEWVSAAGTEPVSSQKNAEG